jgi:hypothetical protein
MSSDFGYWPKLTPRQRLNDAVHKFAQQNDCPYNTAWTVFEERFNEQHSVNLSILRYQHTLTHGTKLTIPGHLEAIGQLQAAIDVAMTMSMEGQC